MDDTRSLDSEPAADAGEPDRPPAPDPACDGCPQQEPASDELVAEAEPEPGEAVAAPIVLPTPPAPTSGPQLEVGVAFSHNTKVYSFASGGLRLSVGDHVLVQTDKGVDLGQVVRIKGRIAPERAGELSPVLRVATADDLAHVAAQRQREREALQRCAEKIAEHNLPMKLIDAHLSFDGTRLVFLFSAEGRVDFRELVRDLARTFRMRIELRQVGVRDEAKLMGGLGPCGRPLCCKMFMRNFEPVGIRIAKDQGLALNPAKLSGLCDRLMCCLRFEHETYLAHKQRLPAKGTRVQTPEGPGEVTEVHVLAEKVTVRLSEGREMTFRGEAVRVLAEGEEGEVVTVPAEPKQTGSSEPRSSLRPLRAHPAPEAPAVQPPSQPEVIAPTEPPASEPPPSATTGRKKKRRSRRKRDRQPEAVGRETAGADAAGPEESKSSADNSQQAPAQPQAGARRKGRRRRGGRRRSPKHQDTAQEVNNPNADI